MLKTASFVYMFPRFVYMIFMVSTVVAQSILMLFSEPNTVGVFHNCINPSNLDSDLDSLE